MPCILYAIAVDKINNIALKGKIRGEIHYGIL